MKKTKDLISKSGKLLLVFGIIFSQLSFPLSVLAAEVSELNEQNEIINQEEPADNTNGKTTEEQNEINTIEEEIIPNENVDFTVELIEEENNNLYIIKNRLNKTLTVKQLKDYDKEITKVINEENTEVNEETEILKNRYQVEKTKEDLTSKMYTIIILADYDDDGMITENDKEALLDNLKESLENDETINDISLVDLNKDEKFDVLDITYPIFTEDKWENDKIATDNLENYLMASSENVYLEEEIEIDYYIEGFQNDTLVGIQGKINYDNSLLELTKITVNGEEKDITELVDNNFIYLLDNYNKTDALITLTFKALAIGTPIVAVEDIVASLGGTKAILDNENVSTSFENLEYGKGGDEEETIPSEPVVTPTTPQPEENIVSETPRPVLLSSNNDIKNLIIKGYEIEFNPNTYEYTIKVANDVNSLDISVLLSSSKAIYYVEGNENFKEGENFVYIVVKAENGSTKTYTIRVEKEKTKVLENKKTNKEKEIKEETEEKASTSKTVIIILIILVIIGLIYVIFKDDEEETKEKEKNTKEVKKTTKKGSKK